jgi:tetratricopeptide (TPR) repeat protein
MLDATEGNVLMTSADAAGAKAVLARAVGNIEKLGANHPALGGTLTALGMSELMSGKIDEAEPHLRAGLAKTEAAYGKMHPEVAPALVNLAILETARGRFVDAIAADDRAIEIVKKAYGADAPTLVQLHGSRGQNRALRGDRVGADDDYAEALRVAERAYGEAASQLIPIRLARADNLAAIPERKADALALAQQAHATVTQVFANPNDLAVAFADAVLARAQAANGMLPEALPLARAAAAKCDAFPTAVPAGPCPLVYQTLGGLAIEAPEREAALAKAEAGITGGAPDPVRLVEIRVALADSLYAHDKPAGMAVAKRGLAAFPRDGDPQLKAALESWIAARPQ